MASSHRLGVSFSILVPALRFRDGCGHCFRVTVSDGNLRLVRASIPAGSNAFDALQTAASPSLVAGMSQSQQLSRLASDTNWNAQAWPTRVLAKQIVRRWPVGTPRAEGCRTCRCRKLSM